MLTLDEVPAVILAGGLGTRLRSVVADRPKVLAQVRGKPFLAYLLEQAAGAGMKRAVLCIGYLGEQIRAVFGDAYAGMRLVYSQEPVGLGTAGALRLALPLCQSDSVLAMNGDSFCEADLREFWAWHCERDANATLLLTEMPDTKRYGRVHVNSDGLLLSFDEKGDKGGPDWINAGIYLLKHRLLLTIPVDRAVSLEQEVFPAWIGRGLYGYQNKGRFLDIGTSEAYAAAEHFFTPEAGYDTTPFRGAGS